MMTDLQTDYEKFEEASVENRRLLAREDLIVQFTEEMARAIKEEGFKRSQVADRMGKTKAFITQILGGGRNLTLRTIADFADALGYSVRVILQKKMGRRELVIPQAPQFLSIPGGKLVPPGWTDARPRQAVPIAHLNTGGPKEIKYGAAA